MLTAGAALAGAPALSLLCLPFLFAAAMTLGDTSNGLMMLRIYQRGAGPARKISYNLLITGVSILSGLLVAGLALATLLTDVAGWRFGLLRAAASVDTGRAGYLLAGFFALVGSAAVLLWRRSSAS